MKALTTSLLAPFIQELSALDSDDAMTSEWAAGLSIMRLVDAWRMGEPLSAWGFRQAQLLVRELSDESRVKVPLGKILETVEQGDRARSSRQVARALWRYARMLELASSWGAAIEVYRMVLLVSDPDDEFRRTRCAIRIAFCVRWSNRLSEALAHYRIAERLARACRDLEGVVWARCGRVSVLLGKGNVPLAARVADRTNAIAERYDVDRVRSRAYHSAATIAYLRNEFETSLSLGHNALVLTRNPREKERILCDIGAAMVGLHMFEQARRIFDMLAATAHQQTTRWGAMLYLLEIESYSGTADELLRYERMILASRVPPAQRAMALVNLGEAYQRMGRDEIAREYLQQGLALAVEHGVSWFVIQAEKALSGRTPKTISVPPATADANEMAWKIQELASSGSK